MEGRIAKIYKRFNQGVFSISIPREGRVINWSAEESFIACWVIMPRGSNMKDTVSWRVFCGMEGDFMNVPFKEDYEYLTDNGKFIFLNLI